MNEKNFLKCDVCKKGFEYSSSLIKHKRIHTGEKPYKCKICSMKFSQGSNLIRHERIHNGNKPYKCAVCLKCFTSSSNLQQHKLIHDENEKRKNYECFLKKCKKSYLYVCTLKKHLYSFHGKEMKQLNQMVSKNEDGFKEFIRKLKDEGERISFIDINKLKRNFDEENENFNEKESFEKKEQERGKGKSFKEERNLRIKIKKRQRKKSIIELKITNNNEEQEKKFDKKEQISGEKSIKIINNNNNSEKNFNEKDSKLSNNHNPLNNQPQIIINMPNQMVDYCPFLNSIIPSSNSAPFYHNNNNNYNYNNNIIVNSFFPQSNAITNYQFDPITNYDILSQFHNYLYYFLSQK